MKNLLKQIITTLLQDNYALTLWILIAITTVALLAA
ncbi:hypothetical protein EV693_10362 [Nicoletella semolina]|uniref:Uncharacterized protein n=1 Tax=Nicoletella semolina TaxID=271160 RepID=A0A4R2NAM1_9PAST|nr:hypothetical protein EV693_10362 [Nicoletella semolina]